ncbi:daptide-type RiPP biosynthesis dehydogenase [Sinomonas susongensis]|uniref:daptide-type RiPP biosynthesis dehydogenase n=1 Tax=Sinomonas susongensis TaxID=1324851 RepID=UPI001FE9A01E|nr:daptide-type RiPP biosynthesis dehydogenase [Sinomonas susongensis]
MIADRTWRTRCVILDEGMAAHYLGRLIDGQTGLVVDRALATHRDRLLDGDLKGAAVLDLDAGPVSFATLRTVSSFIRTHSLTTVVGLGGGSVMDAVTLAVLFTANPGLADFTARQATRSGLIVLPSVAEPEGRARTVLMPSTVGTGAEVSAVACLDADVGRRLVVSRHLSGDVALLDPVHLATLPKSLVLEGILESFLRVAGTMIGSVPSIFDEDGYALLVRIVGLGNRLACEDSLELRLAAARFSMETHSGWSLTCRNPYAAKHWYIANELAYMTGVRKMTATATVIESIWDDIENGSPTWGKPDRLPAVWAAVAAAHPSLGHSAAAGIGELLRRWGVYGLDDISEQVVSDTTNSALRNWGGALPMLRGVGAEQVHDILFNAARLAESTGEPQAARERGCAHEQQRRTEAAES